MSIQCRLCRFNIDIRNIFQGPKNIATPNKIEIPTAHQWGDAIDLQKAIHSGAPIVPVEKPLGKSSPGELKKTMVCWNPKRYRVEFYKWL